MPSSCSRMSLSWRVPCIPRSRTISPRPCLEALCSPFVIFAEHAPRVRCECGHDYLEFVFLGYPTEILPSDICYYCSISITFKYSRIRLIFFLALSFLMLSYLTFRVVLGLVLCASASGTIIEASSPQFSCGTFPISLEEFKIAFPRASSSVATENYNALVSGK